MDTRFTAPVRVGIVGLGRAGWGMHCPELDVYPALFKIVAVCDPIKERRDLAVAKYNCRACRRYEDLLDDHEVELVDIATASDEHVEHALAALATGRWTQLEKPMCRNYDEALVLRAASIKARNRLVIRHNRRFEPEFQQVREIIDSGVLGEVYDIKLRRGSFQRRDELADREALRRRPASQLGPAHHRPCAAVPRCAAGEDLVRHEARGSRRRRRGLCPHSHAQCGRG